MLPLTHDAILKFQHDQSQTELMVARLSVEQARAFDAEERKIYLKKEVYIKLFNKHRLKNVEDLTKISEITKKGIGFSDRPESFVNCGDIGGGQYYRLAIKRSLVSKKLYISTFYRCGRKGFRNHMNKMKKK
ncbi:MAG: hypothetical protein ACPGNT_02055 [Rhodospirillales bacterium]